MNANALRQENQMLRERIEQFRKQCVGNGLRTQIQNFLVESKKNIKEMTERVEAEQQKSNSKLHQVTKQYENVLKEQLTLLTENKELSEQREEQQKIISVEAERLTKEYESKIVDYEKKVQKNVKRLQELGSTNIISKLVKNQKFKNALKERGCDLEGLEKQDELQKIAAQVDEKQEIIEGAEAKSALLDEELDKMRELLQTMRELMENMQKQKENILRQNTMLKQKLGESEELIGKLMGGEIQQDEEEDEDEEEEKVNDE